MSLCGILPRVIVLTILGYGIYELIPMKYILLAVLCAVPVVLIAFAVTAVRKRRQAAAAEAQAQTSGEDRSDPE